MKKTLLGIIITGCALIIAGFVFVNWDAFSDVVSIVLGGISIGAGVAFVANAFDLWRDL